MLLFFIFLRLNYHVLIMVTHLHRQNVILTYEFDGNLIWYLQI